MGGTVESRTRTDEHPTRVYMLDLMEDWMAIECEVARLVKEMVGDGEAPSLSFGHFPGELGKTEAVDGEGW